MHQLLIFLHLIGATIWTGGHLLLAIRYLPLALKTRNPEIILGFEKKFEPLGMPALLVQVVTGIWLASKYGVSPSQYFCFCHPVTTVIGIKMILLFATLALGIHARFFLIPKLSEKNLVQMAIHIIGVTVLSVLFVYVGASVRWGGIF